MVIAETEEEKALERKVQEWKDKCEKLEKNIEASHADIVEIKKSAADAQKIITKVNDCEAEVRKKEEALRLKKEELARMKQNHGSVDTAAVKQLKKTLSDKNEELKKIQIDVEATKSQISAVQAEISGLSSSSPPSVKAPSKLGSSSGATEASKVTGTKYGVGMELVSSRSGDMLAGYPVVDKVIYGSSAAEQGVMLQDRLINIDTQDVNGLSISNVMDKLQGPDGSTVQVELYRAHGMGFLSVTLMLTRSA